jgi:hypothetical protein
MTTLSGRRRIGSSVVAFRSSAGISPRPLKREISAFVFFGSLASTRSRSLSSSAQYVSLPASTR